MDVVSAILVAACSYAAGDSMRRGWHKLAALNAFAVVISIAAIALR